jgi:DNA-binding NarL/FixJ family response regulator
MGKAVAPAASRSPTAGASDGVAAGELTVVLVDRHAVTRVGQRTLLAGDGAAGAAPIRVVGECGDAAEGLRLVTDLRPAVAVIDLLCEDGSGFALVKDVRVQAPATAALVCAAPLAELTVRHLFAIGALGYVRKDEPAEHLAAAVRAVAGGKIYLEPAAAGAMVAQLCRRPRGTLSGAELEVLHMIGTGQSTRAIAAVLHRSIKTIETHRSRLRAKLGLSGPTALAQLAWQFVHPMREAA